MLSIFLAAASIVTTADVIQVKDSRKDELSIEEKIDILAWRTEVLAKACDDLNYKLECICAYLESLNRKCKQ